MFEYRQYPATIDALRILHRARLEVVVDSKTWSTVFGAMQYLLNSIPQDEINLHFRQMGLHSPEKL